jgi:K(+)-stimulated pyrophosphate-energized sodium pump
MNILIKLTCLIGLVIAPILGDGHNLNQNKVMNNSEVKECSADCKMPCCATNPGKDLTINVDVNQTSSGSDSLASVLVTSLKDGDTLTNKENNITGENPNMDSIVKAEKSSAND